MRRMFTAFTALVLALTGCTTSSWESTYVGARPPSGERADLTKVVRVQMVPWERIEAMLKEQDAEVAASDTHPDQWSAEKKGESKAKMLRWLQVSGDAARVDVLGRSTFRTTDRVRPETDEGRAELVKVAQKLDADLVVWSSRYLGKSERVVDRPVTSYRSGTISYVDRAGKVRSQSYSDNETAWVPTGVVADEVEFVAYFLGRSSEVR